jgi:hypothetical protein
MLIVERQEYDRKSSKRSWMNTSRRNLHRTTHGLPVAEELKAFSIPKKNDDKQHLHLHECHYVMFLGEGKSFCIRSALSRVHAGQIRYFPTLRQHLFSLDSRRVILLLELPPSYLPPDPPHPVLSWRGGLKFPLVSLGVSLRLGPS